MPVPPPPEIPKRPEDPGGRPFWSVMMPTYNPRRDMLEISLGSVLSQAPDSAEMEIVVIDDCSSNGSPEQWVREIAGERVRFIRLERNIGLARIWNECITQARGEWIHIFHQDDVLEHGYYESLRRGIESSPDVGAAFCRFTYIDDEGGTQDVAPAESEIAGILPDFLPVLATGPHIICASISVRRSTYEILGGFRPDLTHALDWEMWVRIANRFPIHYEPGILASWRRHDSATTSRQILTGENVRDIAKTIRVWRSYVPAELSGRLARQASWFWANEGLVLAEIFLNRGEYRVFFSQLTAACGCSQSISILMKAARLTIRAAGMGGRRMARRIPGLRTAS